ncbi:deubiquitinase OTUD6B [Leguminivora glycinivorella]|uniref:deubiquitinase OTUD6B n=1 Tax=Leguminivora glycinivorella TaxID=1035111 RepID=UPI00200D51A1|nr:deubiquitinase OTUD6B [Leguminivora glycinivorella]
MDQPMSLEEIEVKHRKEKKELQAHIQGLKKIAKNDKTKKKELTAEIAKLESDLELRHKDELAALENDPGEPEGPEDTASLEDEDEVPKLKVSKAQKRRDKKQQQERERAGQIKLQEKENLHGPRNIEIQSIMNKLKERKLTIFSIPSDGDCLYQAVAHQLLATRSKTTSVEDLRKQVATFMRQNKDDFLPFMSNPNTFEMLTESEFNEYCDEIANTKVWGGQLEIRALSNSLKCPINVIQASGPECIEQGAEFEGPPLMITYHRHMYKLGEHYNSTQAICESDS